MAQVDPPPQSVPTSFARDLELNAYFTYLNKFLFDLWQRSGAGLDLVNGSAQLTLDQEFSGINVFSGTLTLDGISLQVDGVPVVGSQGAVVSDAAAATATDPSPISGYTPHASGFTPVVSSGSTDLDLVAAALSTLRDEVAGLEGTISALVADAASIRTAINTLLSRTRDHGLIDT